MVATVTVGFALTGACSRGSEEAAPDGGSPTTEGTVTGTATSAPGTTVKGGKSSSTTRALSSSTTSASVSSTSTTARPGASSSTSSTRTTATTSPSSTTATSRPPATATSACGDVGFGGPSDELATGVAATGVSCNDASALVVTVRSSHNVVSGPRSFSAGGYECTVVTENAVLPVGHYACVSGSKKVTWSKT